MSIRKTLLPPNQLKPLFTDINDLQFGRVFTDYIFMAEYSKAKGWHNAEIKPYQNLVLDPAATIFHYGQAVFEGQKAYRSKDGRILLFRPLENAKRFNTSLARMCMPEISEEFFLQAEIEMLKLEERWIPAQKGTSLYIRPTAIATEAALGVKASDKYIFYIICSPSGPYYQKGFKPISLWVSNFYTRASLGGTGEAKTGGNYAASLLAAHQAKQLNHDQVLWLDAKENKYVEEVGAMNIFFVMNNKLLTPKLHGSILPGITRKSILQLAKDLGLKTEERFISIDEITSGISDGSLTEIFGSGTAAVVSPVGKIHYKGKEYAIANKDQAGPWTQKIYDVLVAIQYGEVADPYGWVFEVK